MRACFICKSDSQVCGHREPAVLLAEHEATMRAQIAAALREGLRAEPTSGNGNGRVYGAENRSNGKGAK